MDRIVSKDNRLGRVAGRPRLGVLEKSGAEVSLADLLLRSGQAGDAFRIDAADSVDSLLERAEGGAFDAILVAPELPEGWPVSIADNVIDAVAGRVPLIIVCRNPQDAAVIESRGRQNGVVVLLRGQVGGSELANIVRGELARRGASMP